MEKRKISENNLIKTNRNSYCVNSQYIKKSQIIMSIVCILVLSATFCFVMYNNEIFGSTTNDNVKRESQAETQITYDYLIKNCTTPNYDDMTRYPLQFKGKPLTFTGSVLQINESKSLLTDNIIVEIKLLLESDEFISSDIVSVSVVRKETSPHILEDDEITVYGICTGTETYTTFVLESKTVPSMEAYYIKMNGNLY